MYDTFQNFKKSNFDQKFRFMEFLELDRTSFPIVKIKINRFEATAERLNSWRALIEDLLNEYTNFIIIQDLSDAKSFSAEERIKMGKWLQMITPKMKEKLLAFYFVTTSPVQLMILKGIFLITKMPVD